MNKEEAVKKGYKPFKVIGHMAHQRPKKHVDTSRIVWAKDALHAMDVYARKLKGVKKRKLLQVVAV